MPRPRKPLVGTPQQESFWGELECGDSNGHILLEARAGTGKSTSCREGMHRLLEARGNLAIRYACFNTKIAEEFRAKCPDSVEVGTMHRFAFEALGRSFGSKLDEHKTYTVLDGMPGGAALKRYLRKSISTIVGLAKNHALHPGQEDLRARLNELVYTFDVETWRKQHEVLDWATEVLAKSLQMTSLVDFDDMLWMASLLDVRFPSIDFLFIDEAQDLNPVQLDLAARMGKGGRVVAVADPYQSIYAFRGADSESVPKLKRRFGMQVMPLTVTFRCPRSHVELARELVPDFEAAPEAPEGTLTHGGRGLVELAEPGDLVLCRANAPIVQACLRAIGQRRPAIVRGRAIGDQLMGVLRKIGDRDTVPELVRAVAEWRGREIAVLEAKEGTENQVEAVNDKAACLDAIASSCSSPAELPGVIARLFDDSDSSSRITFSSVHRAKGSEARRVTYIQIPYGEKRDKVRPPQQWELDQRRNLRYVALTRSLDTLTLVS